MNDFGNPYYSDTENYKPLQEREFKVTIDGVKTTIICKFHNGILVTFSSTSEKVVKPSRIKPTTTTLSNKRKERFIKKRG